MSRKISRRSFLQTAAAGAAAATLFPRRTVSAATKLRHASVGVMGQGRSDLGEIYSSDKVDLVAMCDIDATRLAEAAKTYPNARLYRDWREMLDKEDKNIDSVNIAIPDHMHAPVAMSAIKQGKHVYCEKPLTHEVYEARQVTLAAREAGVVTQMGIQIHAHDFYRTAVIWLQEGAIGKVKEWHSWSAASYTIAGGERPAGEDPVPAEVDWDLWLGTAPERPYLDKQYHPFEWRRWRDFGGGATADFGCHIFDPVFTALGIGAPLNITAQAEMFSEEVWPAWAIFDYEFPGTALTTDKIIKASWSDGGKQPDKARSPHIPADYELPKSGSMIIGEEGSMILPHIGRPELFPTEKFANYAQPTLDPINHYHQFVDACLGNGKTGAPFDFSGPLTEAVLLGNVANRFAGQKLEWDAANLRFTNSHEASEHLRRRYRRGWRVKGL